MKKIIVLEGPDNSGKSYLAKKISEFPNTKLLSFPIRNSFNNTKYKQDSASGYELSLQVIRDLPYGVTHILDRWYHSNIIYDGIRGTCDIDMANHYLSRFRSENKVLEIFLTREEVEDDFSDDNLIMDKSNFNKVINRYKELYLPYHQVVYNDSIDNLKANYLIEKAKRFINEV